MLHEVFADILEKELGAGTGMAKKIASVPGWSQGILFGFLSKMGCN